MQGQQVADVAEDGFRLFIVELKRGGGEDACECECECECECVCECAC